MTVIKIKNSAVAGKVPDSGDLEIAELGLNIADKKLYSKDASGEIFEIGIAGDVPSGPTPPLADNNVGDLFWDTTNGTLNYWDGAQWVPITAEPIDGEGYVKVSGDNMTGALTIGPDGGPAVTTLAADGDITGGTYDQSSNTTAGYELTNTGILKVQRPASEGNNPVYKAIRVLAGTEENASISADGSAQFGNVEANRYYANLDNDTDRFRGYTSQANGTKLVFQVDNNGTTRIGGSNTAGDDPTISLNNNGSATFEGNIDAADGKFSVTPNQVKIGENTGSSSQNSSSTIAKAEGTVLMFHESGSTKPFFQCSENGVSTRAIIRSDGSAEFAGGVTTHGFNSTNGIGVSPGVYINNDSAVSDQINSALLVTNASDEETVDIKSDGSAVFEGTLNCNSSIYSQKPNASGFNFQAKDVNGDYYFGAKSVSAGSGSVIIGGTAADPNIELTVDGSSSFTDAATFGTCKQN